MLEWIDVMPVAELEATPKRVVRVDGRQMLIVRTKYGVSACLNRCPHEGYPLSEGELCANGTLRCHWHNWTFDLVSGEALVGGDALRQFPTKVEHGRVLVAPQPPDITQTRACALTGVVAALGDADQPRLLRETARLMLAGGDPLDGIRASIGWLAPRLQYGTTHAIAGAADWLALADAPGTQADQRLAALGEILGHIADDGRREGRFPFSAATRPWDAEVFLTAVEAGDESTAVASVRGALAAGIDVAQLTPTLATAALAHYADFGHSLIYTVKSAELIERLGQSVAEPLLCLLVRSLCYATREDLLPEFHAYRDALARFTPRPATQTQARPSLLTGVSITQAIDAVVSWSATYGVSEIFRTLVDSAALTLLHVDEASLRTTSGTIAKNASWLNHTHALTFAEAGERVARVTPALWPAVLLQIACFIGQSHPFVDLDQDVTAWQGGEARLVMAELRESLFDHGRDRFIISVHLIKSLFSAVKLIDGGHADAEPMTAAMNRFFHAPMKGRHVIRTARQMLAVAAER
jgi:nitrite reductase/ring-hydroxylating ferredoxin subunit